MPASGMKSEASSRASSGFRFHVLIQPDQQIKGLQPRAPLLIFYHNFAVQYTASHSNLGWSFAVATLHTLAGRCCSVLNTNHDFAAQYTAGHSDPGWYSAVATLLTLSRRCCLLHTMRAELLSQPQGLDVGGTTMVQSQSCPPPSCLRGGEASKAQCTRKKGGVVGSCLMLERSQTRRESQNWMSTFVKVRQRRRNEH